MAYIPLMLNYIPKQLQIPLSRFTLPFSLLPVSQILFIGLNVILYDDYILPLPQAGLSITSGPSGLFALLTLIAFRDLIV